MTQGRAEKAPESENIQTDSDDSSQGLTEQTQTPSQTLTSDSRGRMINDVMTLAAEVQRLVGQISRETDEHPIGDDEGGEEGEEGERVGSLPPPYSPSS